MCLWIGTTSSMRIISPKTLRDYYVGFAIEMGPERLSGLTKIPQTISGLAGIWT